ncbi:MAG TPA: FAD binding domain-containing protein [Stellaceae bacterium]|nr:FAD binding domain-containing protein [Stellaceae bacterium]
MSAATMAGSSAAELRAGGTDVSERRRSGVSAGPLIDLIPSAGMTGIAWGADGAARIGAATTIAAIAGDRQIIAAYPGFAAAAGGLATPQLRHLATLGGNLAQHSRCWYYRHPHVSCLKKGGSDCPARRGNHLHGVAFDLGPCVAPHPSTMAAALLAYDGVVRTDRRPALSIPELLGDGSAGTADNALRPGEIIESIALSPPLANERALYQRAIGRTHAEWPLVEIVARTVISGGSFQLLRLAAGGVAPVPLRLSAAEAIGEGAAASASTMAAIAEQATAGARPLPMTGYKLDLMKGLVRHLLERLVG